MSSEKKQPWSTVLAPYFVYLLRCGDGTLYTGTARDPERRLDTHNRGKGAKYTRSRLPVTLIYQQLCGCKGDALKRELAIKALSHREKEQLAEDAENGWVGMHFSETLTPEDFMAMEALEKRCYDPSHVAPWEEAYDWYRAFPPSSLAVFHEERLAGFINLFPVTDRTYAGLLSGVFDDSQMTLREIADPETGGPLHLFLSCIAVEPEYRGRNLSMELYWKALSAYAPWFSRVDAIITDNVTPAGQRFSARLGLAVICESQHGSVIRGMRLDRSPKAP